MYSPCTVYKKEVQMLNRSKHQVRINLRPDVLEKATKVAQSVGRSLSEVIEDSILRTTELQMEIDSSRRGYKRTLDEFQKIIKEQMDNLGVQQCELRTATKKATNNDKPKSSSP